MYPFYLYIVCFAIGTIGKFVAVAKTENSILHPNIQVISLSDDAPGHASKDIWIPSKVERNGAESRQNQSRESIGNLSHDYIDSGRNITPANSIQGDEYTEFIVEMVVVCDKEFGDVFNHDRQKILDYFTVYFWDVSLAFRTLPSTKISFRINAIVVINSIKNQPFIEESRDSKGIASMNSILPKFSYWIYQQIPNLPKYDMAVIITNTKLTWGGGLAYVNAACGVDHDGKWHWGVTVWNDNGNWGSRAVGAHEIAHVVGMIHDGEDEFNGECSNRTKEDQWYFFSPCADRKIAKFVRSEQASCLRRIDEVSKGPVITPDFSRVLAPTMTEQCRLWSHNRKGEVEDKDTGDCKSMKCWTPGDNGGWTIWWFSPLENSPCLGEGRCFRGRCRKIGQYLFNLGTGECAKAPNEFAFEALLEMKTCSNYSNRGGAIPMDTFVVEENKHGKFLYTPYAMNDGTELGERCVYTGGNWDRVWTDRCDFGNAWQAWLSVDMGNGEFMLQHAMTKRWARPDGAVIRTYTKASRRDKNFRWKFV